MKDVNYNDPVNGQWLVRKPESCKVWCDASSIALGIAVQVDNSIIEDAMLVANRRCTLY